MKNIKLLGAVALADKLRKWCEVNKHKKMGTNGMLNCGLINIMEENKKATSNKGKIYTF